MFWLKPEHNESNQQGGGATRSPYYSLVMCFEASASDTKQTSLSPTRSGYELAIPN
jgi:hypothetical protein